jgi:hypothetical protein
MEGYNMKIEFVVFEKGQNWVSAIVNDGEYTVSAKLFDEGSRYGINNGRVSMLSIHETAKTTDKNWFDGCIVNYDRGWDIRPKTEKDKEVFKAVLKFLEDAPKTRFS